MVSPIPDNVKKVWDEWNLRGFILLSLSLQTFLILFAPFRKRTANIWVILFIWSAYLLADWAANFSVGLISNNKSGKDPSGAHDNANLLAFWAPFLLVHLGGPDTITAFALEDNELWLRHLLGLLFQLIATVYVFIQTIPGNNLWLPTLLLFLAGIIKYVERTRALYLASLDKFRESMLKDPDPGPNYAKLMEEYASKKDAKLPTRIEMILEPDKESKVASTEVKDGNLSNLEVVQYAYHYFKIFKGLIVDLIFSFRERNESRDFFQNRSPEDAFRVIEVELNFIYEVLYTKVVVVHSILGYIFRFISFCSVVAALALFHFRAEQKEFKRLDVRITYTLLLGALGLDAIAFFMLIFSDWSVADRKPWKEYFAATINSFLELKKPKWSTCKTKPYTKYSVLARSMLLRRWSESVSGYNLITYCLKGRPIRIHTFGCCLGVIIHMGLLIAQIFHYLGLIIVKIIHYLGIAKVAHYLGIHKVFHFLGIIIDIVIDYLGLRDFLDRMRYMSKVPFTKQLWEFIFNELKDKSKRADHPATAKKISSARGEWVLQDSDSDGKYSDLMKYVEEVDYDQSLILWHIATDLCYNTEEGKPDGDDDNREFSKILSDYMLYLLVMQPTMMSAVAGIGQIRFRDTCAEAKRFLSRRGLGPQQGKTACDYILLVNTDVEPVAVKGDRSKSVLFDASMLAKKLRKLEREDKWKITSKVWVELLSYAASNCRTNTHAQQVSRGGELLSFIWLLMAHLGLGEQFQINEGHARAKLIVGK